MDIQDIGTLMAITVGGSVGFIFGFTTAWVISRARSQRERV